MALSLFLLVYISMLHKLTYTPSASHTYRDVKPYVPHYDCVGYSNADNNHNTMQSLPSSSSSNESDVVRVPDWVDSGLQKRRKVTFLPAANQFLQDLASSNSSTATASSLSSQLQEEDEQQRPSITQLQFYGPNSPWADSPQQAITNVKQCIYELLSVDVRSAWQTKKAREGKFQAERSSRVKEWSGKADDSTTHNNASGSDDSEEKRDNESKKKKSSEGSQLCTQQIDNLLVRYTIEEPGSALYREGVNAEDNNNNDGGGRGCVVDERSMGSGAEDIVVVHTISFLK